MWVEEGEIKISLYKNVVDITCKTLRGLYKLLEQICNVFPQMIFINTRNMKNEIKILFTKSFQYLRTNLTKR